MDKLISFVLSTMHFAIFAAMVAITVSKPVPWNVGCSVFLGLLACRSLLMDAVRDHRLPR